MDEAALNSYIVLKYGSRDNAYTLWYAVQCIPNMTITEQDQDLIKQWLFEEILGD